jgi:hypothetical protein
LYSLPQSYNQTSKCKRCISSNAYKAGIGLGFSNTKTIGVSNCNLGGYVGVPSTASAKDGIFDK